VRKQFSGGGWQANDVADEPEVGLDYSILPTMTETMEKSRSPKWTLENVYIYTSRFRFKYYEHWGML
jgi:hypothetical protein